MSRVFSDFIRSLDAGGKPPEAEDFDALWQALAATLQREIRRRGLWHLSPEFLGVHGRGRWSADAVDELVAPCYEHTFIDRQAGLLAQLQVKDNVDGLVVLHVRNFLHELQRHHDQLGFRVYKVLRAAIKAGLEAGEWRVLAGDPRLRNDTVLGRADSPRGPLEPPGLDEIAELREIAGRWNDLLLPELVTAQGRAQAAVADHLRRLLGDLSARGLDTFRFADLIEPLKDDVRGRWARLLDQDLGEVAFEDGDDGLPRLVRRLEPVDGWAEQQHFDRLVACVTEAVEGEAAGAGGYLVTLWHFLRSWAGGAAVEASGPMLPSKRRLAALLRIPRDRLGGLFASLAEMVDACLPATAVNGAVRSLGRADHPPSRGTLP